jgi:hypothetical protein
MTAVPETPFFDNRPPSIETPAMKNATRPLAACLSVTVPAAYAETPRARTAKGLAEVSDTGVFRLAAAGSQ